MYLVTLVTGVQVLCMSFVKGMGTDYRKRGSYVWALSRAWVL